MTWDEAKTLLAIIATNYPPALRPEVTKVTIETWQELLGDIGYERASIAIKKWMTTNSFPPTINDVRKIVTVESMPSIDTANAAWGRIQKAVARFGYPAEDKAREFLGASIWNTVKERGWMHYCEMDEREEMANFAQFRDAYLIGCKREQEQAQIPDGVQRALKMIGGGA